jgi:hypothetical protein
MIHEDHLKITLIFVFFITSVSAFDLTGIEFYGSQTSDQIDVIVGDVKYQRNAHELFWPYQNQIEKNSWGLNYFYKEIDGPAVDAKFQEFLGNFQYVEFEAINAKLIFEGGFYQTKEENLNHSKTNVKLSAHYQIYEKGYTVEGRFARENAYRRILLLNGNPIDLNSFSYMLRIHKKFFEDKVSLQGKWLGDHLRDDNRRRDSDLEVMYAFMTYPHWIRAGFGYQNLSFKKNSSAFWSPDSFYSYGPRIDMSVDLTHLSFILGGNYVWFEENKVFDGNGYYLRTGLSYGNREEHQLRLLFEKNESLQNNNTWTNEAIRFVFNKAW